MMASSSLQAPSASLEDFVLYRFNGATCPMCGYDCNGNAMQWVSGARSVQCLHLPHDQAPEGWKGVKKSAGWSLFWANSPEAKLQWEKVVEESGQGSRGKVSKGYTTEGGNAFVVQHENLITQEEIDAVMVWAERLGAWVRNPSHADYPLYQDLEKRGWGMPEIHYHQLIDFNIVLPGPNKVTPFEAQAIDKLFGTRTLNRVRRSTGTHPVEFYAIPYKDFTGRVRGFQIRNLPSAIERAAEKGRKLGKYIWAGNHRVNGKKWTAAHPETGTPPLQVRKGSSRMVLLAEGGLKPLIVWEALLREHTIIGAAGGAFMRSGGELLSTLFALKLELGITDVVWLADGGSFEKKIRDDGEEAWKRSNVVGNIEAVKSFCEEHGFNFHIADWGQLDKKEEGLDPDEVGKDVLTQSLPPLPLSPQEQMGKMVAQVFSSKASLQIDYQTPQREVIETVYVNSTDDVSEVYRTSDKTYIINNMSLGSGKSYSLEHTPMDDFSKHIYVSLTPRNPATPHIESEFYKLEGRHSGLVTVPGSSTPLGFPVLRRPKKSETPQTEANCAFAELHNTARKNGMNSSRLCHECPFHNACLSGTHEHYDYLYQRVEADKRSKIRVSLATLNHEHIDESVLLTIDEPSSSAPFTESFTISTAEARHYVTSINERLKRQALSVDTDMVASFDNPEEIIAAAASVDNEIQALIQRQYYRKDKLNNHYKGARALCSLWVELLLNPHIKWTLKDGSYCCLVRNTQALNVIHNAGRVIFLDATCEPEILAAQYGLPLDQCLVIKNEDKAVNNVTTTVLLADGLNSRKQSISRKRSIMAEVRELLNAKFGERAVGYITHSEYCEPGDIAFFSESRGSNRFQKKKAICLFGLPQIDIEAANQQWQLLRQHLPGWDFENYYKHLTHSELKQSIGRIRGWRREEPLEVYVVANCRLGRLEKDGYDVRYKVAALTGVTSAHTPQIDALMDIYRAAKHLTDAKEMLTFNALAEVVGKTRQSISKSLKRLNLALETLTNFFCASPSPQEFVGLPLTIQQALGSSQKHNSALPPSAAFWAFSHIPLSDTLEAMKVLATPGTWPKGVKRQDIPLLYGGLLYASRDLLRVGRGSKTIDDVYGDTLQSICCPDVEYENTKETNCIQDKASRESLRKFVSKDLE